MRILDKMLCCASFLNSNKELGVEQHAKAHDPDGFKPSGSLFFRKSDTCSAAEILKSRELRRSVPKLPKEN